MGTNRQTAMQSLRSGKRWPLPLNLCPFPLGYLYLSWELPHIPTYQHTYRMGYLYANIPDLPI